MLFNKYFLAFTIIPLTEIAILISLSDIVGGWTTIAIVVATALIGTSLIKNTGKEVMENLQKAMMLQGNITDAILDGAILLVTGVLLITPGFFTDIFGLLIHLPLFKNILKKFLVKKFKDKMQGFSMDGNMGNMGGFSGFSNHNSSNFNQEFEKNDSTIIEMKDNQDDYYVWYTLRSKTVVFLFFLFKIK